MPYCVTAESNFENLKTLFTQKNVYQPTLAKIKSHFKDDISSPRRYDSIKTLPDLINCMERIGILSQYDIDRLNEIAQYLEDDEIEMALDKYVKPPEEVDVNIYALQRARERNDHKFIPKNVNEKPKVEQKSVVIIEFTESKRNDIYKIVSQEIGRKWRCFARELGVRSGTLDKIEVKHPNDLQSRVYEVFEIFENDPRSNPREHLNIICEALERCSRKDLLRSVKKIMSF